MVNANTRLRQSVKIGWQKSPMLKNASITFSLRFSGAVLLFVFNWLIVQFLGIENSGVFFLAYTLLNIFSALALFGVDQYELRKISRLDEGAARSQFIKGGYFTLLTASLGFLLMAALANYFSDIFKSPGLAQTLRLVAPTVLFLTLTTYLGTAARARKKFTQSVFILTNSSYMMAILFFLAAWLLGYTSLANLSLAFTLALATGLVINAWLVFRIYRFRRLRELIIKHRPAALLKIGKRSWQLFLVSAIYLGFGSITVLLIGFFLSDADVSIYAVAEKEAKLLTFSLFAINMILAPSVSKFFAQRNLLRLNREIQKATILSVLFSLPILIAFLVWPNFFMGIFGQEYVVGANVLRLLAIGQAINAATGAVFITMTMAHLEKKLNIISVVALVTQLTLGAWLIPAFGIIGASWATLLGWSLVNILGLYYLNKHHSIRVFPTRKLIRELATNAKNSLS